MILPTPSVSTDGGVMMSVMLSKSGVERHLAVEQDL